MKNVVAFLVICLMTTPVWAGLKEDGADYLVKVGEISYQKGNIENAIHEFSKALLMDPHNSKAKQYLNEMGYAQGLYTRPPSAAARLDQMAQEIELYREMLAHVEEQRQDIQKQLKDLSAVNGELAQDNDSKTAELQNVREKVEQLGLDLHRMQKEHEALMEASRRDFDRERKHLSMSLELEQAEDARLGPYGMTYAQLNEKISDGFDLALHKEHELLALSRENRDLKKELSSERSSSSNMTELFEDYVYLKQAQMNDIANQAVIDALKDSGKDQKILEKTKALNDSQKIIEDSLRKTDEKDAIIVQKNLQIQDLQQRLEWYQKNIKTDAQEPEKPVQL